MRSRLLWDSTVDRLCSHDAPGCPGWGGDARGRRGRVVGDGAVSGKYRTIVADPPWDLFTGPGWEFSGPTKKPPYPTMSLEEIKALPVKDLSDNLDGDTHLYLWTVNAYLRDAFDVARAWGFHPTQTLVWAKPPRPKGLGGIFPSNVEFVLFCRRPKVVSRPDALRVTTYLADAADAAGVTRRQLDDAMGTSDMAGWWLSRIGYRCACPSWEQFEQIKQIVEAGDAVDDLVLEINGKKGTKPFESFERMTGSWFTWPRGAHSAKPEAFIDMVEQVSPPPYIELFARRHRLGWDVWGNEVTSSIELGITA
jgi:N6-adenosine-specific RNA methylase IME4